MTHEPTVREAVAVFRTKEGLEAAVDDLLLEGFARRDLSLLASDEAVRKELGHDFGSTRELEDDAKVPTVAYVAREDVGDAEGAVLGGFLYVGALAGAAAVVASGGALPAAILAATLGGSAGAGVGGWLAHLVGKHHADSLERQIAEGGLLLWVRTHDAAHELKATSILKRHGGEDVHVHGLPDSIGDVLEPHYMAQADLPETARVPYAGYDVLVMADGHCYVAGRLFANEAEARRYLDDLARER
ncbi:MAG: hypothetical protein ACOCYE_11545 [Pseudomonadota bacterium]